MPREQRRPAWLRVVIREEDPAAGTARSKTRAAQPIFDLVAVGGDSGEAPRRGGPPAPVVTFGDLSRTAPRGSPAPPRNRAHGGGAKAASPSTQLITSGGAATIEGDFLVRGGSLNDVAEAIKHCSEGGSVLPIEISIGVIDELAGRLSLRFQARARRLERERRTRVTLRQRDALSMVFQPIVTLEDRKILGAEALARFAGPPKRAPRRCFAEAPTIALLIELELAAVREALVALPQLPEAAFLAVNVSPVTLTSPVFHELVREVEATRLVAEVTEHAPIFDYDRIGSAIGRLRSLGMRLAVDDAGAGFASLRHILKLSPDLIKLDLTLIRNIQHDRSKQALAAGLISFADKCGAIIIAEGVERAAEARALVELGVRHGQGFYLGRPAPLPLHQRAERVPRGQLV